MRVERVNLDELSGKLLDLGFVGEQNHTKIIITCAMMFKNYPDAVATMVATPPVGDTYPVQLTRDGNTLEWNVSTSDLAYAGSGSYQLTFTEDEEIIKVEYGSYFVKASMTSTGEPPVPLDDWMQEATATLEALEEISASASTLAAGSSATAQITTVEGHRNIAIGIPKGDKGDTGSTGADGYSPTATVSKSGTTATITITDKTGTTTATVNDGVATDAQITTAVDTYLGDHFTNPSNPPLDRSLESTSSAAPADLVGDLKNETNYNWKIYQSNKADIPLSTLNFQNRSVNSNGVIVTGSYPRDITSDMIPISNKTDLCCYTSSLSNFKEYYVYLYNDAGTLVKTNYISASGLIVPVRTSASDNATQYRIRLTFTADTLPTALQDHIFIYHEYTRNDMHFKTGKNLFNPNDESVKDGYYLSGSTGAMNASSAYGVSGYIPVKNNVTVVISPAARHFLAYDKNGVPISASWKNTNQNNYAFTPSADGFIRFTFWASDKSSVQVETGSTPTTYEAYRRIAEDGIDFLNNTTKTKVQQMIGDGTGKSIELASYLNGKTVAVFGDSIMQGGGNDNEGPADILADKYNMTVADYTVSGSTMGVRTDDPSYTADELHHIAKQIRTAIAASIDPDIILIDGGTNDIGGSITLGEITQVYTEPADENNFANGFETAAYLMMKNFVGVPVIYLRAHNMSSRSYSGQKSYGELGIQIAEKWGIYTIDMYKRMNTQLSEYASAYLSDYTHPNEAGYLKYYVPAIEELIFNKLI